MFGVILGAGGVRHRVQVEEVKTVHLLIELCLSDAQQLPPEVVLGRVNHVPVIHQKTLLVLFSEQLVFPSLHHSLN
jgi:hypothetical protein